MMTILNGSLDWDFFLINFILFILNLTFVALIFYKKNLYFNFFYIIALLNKNDSSTISKNFCLCVFLIFWMSIMSLI